MPTASRFLLEFNIFKQMFLKFYISRYLFLKKWKRLQILCGTRVKQYASAIMAVGIKKVGYIMMINWQKEPKVEMFQP